MAYLSPCPPFCSLQANNLLKAGDLRWGALLSSLSSLRSARLRPSEAGDCSPRALGRHCRGTHAASFTTGASRFVHSSVPKGRIPSSQPHVTPFHVHQDMPSCPPQHISPSRPQTPSSVTRATSRSMHNHPILEPARRGENRGEMSYQVEAVLSNLMSLPPRGSMARCMDSFKGKISMQDFALIFRELSNRGDWIRAMRLFKYMQRQQWCTPSEHIYTIMIGILGRVGMPDKAQELFDEMRDRAVEWNVFSFTALINAYGRNGQHDTALRLLSVMKQEGVQPNCITYNTVLHSAARSDVAWDSLVSIFSQMRKDGVQPDLVTYNTLLAACASRSLVDEAAMVFRSLIASGVPPDMVSYSTLVDTHHRARSLSAVRTLFTAMAEEEGVVADVAAYNLLIEAYGWSGDYQSASKVFQEMQQVGCPPQGPTYTALLAAMGSGGAAMHTVRSVFHAMKDAGCRPDLSTYRALLGVYVGGGYFREACSLFDDMVADGVELDTGVFESLLSACAMGGLTDKATEIYRHMQQREGLQPSVGSLEALVRAYGQAAMYPEALCAVHDAMDLGYVSRMEPFLALMEAYASGGMYDDAAFIFALQQQLSADAPPSLDASAASFLDPSLPSPSSRYSSTLGGPVAPVPAGVFNALITAFARGGQYEEGMEVDKDMKIARCMPDAATHSAMIATYVGAGMWEAAYAQLLDMQEEGIQPPVHALCLLLSLSARRSRWSDVTRMLRVMEHCALESSERQHYAMAAAMLQGRYDDGDAWPIAEQFIKSLRARGVSPNRVFINCLIDALWSLGRRRVAVRTLAAGLELGVFPEASHRTANLWSLDVHRMTAGAATASLYQWLRELRHVAATYPTSLPPLFSIITRYGEESRTRDEIESFPVRKAALAVISTIDAPFQSPTWNTSRFVADQSKLLPWLLDIKDEQLILPDLTLPYDAFRVQSNRTF